MNRYRKEISEKIIKREYSHGDENQINNLYKTLKKIDRTNSEYRWEWIETWNGKGSIWLGFDKSRNENEQLIMQYSLIPTPLSFWGNVYLAGKTENCMCHPDYRSKGVYFRHEKEFFEKTKEIYSAFFTTSGNVSRGAAGAVRRKLGYKGLDSWVTYFYCFKDKRVEQWIYEKIKNKFGDKNGIFKILSIFISKIISNYCLLNKCENKNRNLEIKLVEKEKVLLNEIEKFWNNNSYKYGITIDRNKKYLEWRINKNPYADHKYLIYYKNKEILGYLIFYCKNGFCHVVDLISQNKDREIMIEMLSFLKDYGLNNNIYIIISSAAKHNKTINKVFTDSGFLNNKIFQSILMRLKPYYKNPIHVFLTQELISEYKNRKEELMSAESWYINDLFKEGRAG